MALAVWLAAATSQAQRLGTTGESAPTWSGGEIRTDALMRADGGSPEVPLSPDATTSLTFSAITLTETSTVPPDGSLAAGPTQVVVLANGRLRSFSKATGVADGVLNLQPDTFFSTVRAGHRVFGGRVRFDRWTGRWYLSMATDGAPGRLVLAASDTAVLSASTVWRFSAIDNTFGDGSCTIDPPTLAIDSLALYLGVNQFCGGAYAGTSAFVIRKTSTVGTGSLVATAFHNLTGTAGGAGLFAPRGVENQHAAATSGYLIGVDNAALGRILVRRIVDPGGTPSLLADQAVTLPMTLALPVRVPHAGNTAGTAGDLEASDDRLMSAVWRDDGIWVTHSVGPSDGASVNSVLWHVIGTPATTPALHQSGRVGGQVGDTRHIWLPSLAVTGAGRTVIGFNAAGPADGITAGLVDRSAADPVATTSTPTWLTTAPASYNPSLDSGGSTGRRWGRYSDTVVDGCDDRTVWSLQSVVGTQNAWTLQVARVRPAAPATISTISPSSVPAGVASVDVTVTGTGGTFDDSGAGFLCRLAATIPGVTVNSATLVTNTSVRLNISTVNVPPGARQVTLINPDGQTSTSAATLTVLPGLALAVDAVGSGQPLVVRGWALDGRTTAGTGISTVTVTAQPAVGSPIALGQATLGVTRSDAAALFGAPFASAGFSLRAATSLPVGTYTLVITATSSVNGETTTRSVTVTPTAPTPPFGTVDTPAEGAVVAGEVGVTGWALDAAGVRDVRIYRNSVGTEAGPLVYVGTADVVRGARPDVQAAYPSLPDNDLAGWGFMVLTNMLPGGGNGAFVLSAYATNHAGQSTLLGTRTIQAANAGSQIPFGTIDTPGQGAEVSGTIVNFGWALTPSPLGIPTDGSTIRVYIDGVFVGHPVYNQYRSDIATLFPGYANSNGAVGYFMIDTTRLANGLHSIAWGVQDAAGNVNGIGSRNFRVNNGS